MRHLYVCRETVNPGPTICLLYTMVNLKSTKKSIFGCCKWLVCNIYDTTYDELISVDSDVSIHQRHLRFLITRKISKQLKCTFYAGLF